MRTWSVFVVGGLLLVGVGLWGTEMMRADAHHDGPDAATHGPLTDDQYAAAVRVAQRQVDRARPHLTSATAIVRRGTVKQPNLSGHCRSGRVIQIQLIGDFPHTTTGGRAGGPSGPVTEMDLTADAASGQPCLLGVSVGHPKVEKNAADLLPAIDQGQ